MEQVKKHKWSLDACVGYARLHGLFSAEEMVCTHTLYNEVWAGSLDLSVTELPEAMKRKQHKDSKPREHKKSFGTDISQRPEIAALRIEEGHWECDTVVGKRAGKEAAVLSLLEKKTENYIAIRIPGKDADSVLNAMQSLREEFGDQFSQGVNPKFCVTAKLWCKIEQKCFKAGAAQAAAAFSTKITALRGDVKGGGVSLRSSRLLTFRLQPVSPACGRQRTPPTVRELRSSPAAFRSTSS